MKYLAYKLCDIVIETSLHEILERSASVGLDLQRKNGSMPPGMNGPYGEEETPVSNTCHWVITFLKCIK